MFSASEMPKIVVASVIKIPRANDPPGRGGGGGANIGGGYGIGGGIIPGGGIMPGGAGGGVNIGEEPPPVGGGGGANAPRGSIGPCPGGGCGIIGRPVEYGDH